MKNILVIIDHKVKEAHSQILTPIGEEVFKNKHYVETLELSNEDIKDESLFTQINKSLLNKNKLVIIITNGFKLRELIELIDYNEDNDNLETELIQIDESLNLDDYSLNKNIYKQMCDANKYKSLKEYIINKNNHEDNLIEASTVGKNI